MPRDDEKLLRQLSLVSFLLSAGRPVGARDVQQSVEGYATMSDETFVRRFYGDREDLAGAGIQIEQTDYPEDPSGLAYSLPPENYYLADPHFTDDERRSLVLVLAVLEGRFAYARPLRLALASLLGGPSSPARDELDRVAVRLAADAEANSAGDRLARLDDAVSRGKTVTFDYRTAHGESAKRTLDPYSLFRIAGHWYVVGRDHDRSDLRMFRLGRIQGAVRFATKRPKDFSVPPGYDPESFRSRPPWLLGNPVGTAKVKLDASLGWWVRRTLPRASSGGSQEPLEEACESGDAILELPYADPHALVAWVLGLGARAELLEPEVLRDMARDRLDAVIAAHPEGPPHPTDHGHLGNDRGGRA
jgi:predicted DNA-binding transcriptional regulator YafY